MTPGSMRNTDRLSPKEIRTRVTAIGRPLRFEVSIDGRWLERLKRIVRNMDASDGSYSLQRYLEELIEADIVYREAFGTKGPFLSRHDIMYWLHQRHARPTSRRTATAGERG